MLNIIKTQLEVEQEIERARESQFDSKFGGMTYEDGIIALYEWLIGRNDDKPMED